MTQTCPSPSSDDLIARFLTIYTGMTREQADFAVDFFLNPRPGKDYKTEIHTCPQGIDVKINLDLAGLNADEAKQIESLVLADLSDTVGKLQHWLPIYRENRKGSKINDSDMPFA